MYEFIPHVANTPTFSSRDVALPLGSRHTQPTVRQVDVLPLERHHLAAPQSGFASYQHNYVGERIAGGCGDQAARPHRTQGSARTVWSF